MFGTTTRPRHDAAPGFDGTTPPERFEVVAVFYPATSRVSPMLVLGRKAGERVRVSVQGPDGKPLVLLVTLVKVQGARVRLGFQGSPEIRVVRDELSRDEGQQNRKGGT